MAESYIRELFNEYTKERNIEMSEEQFASFLAFFPALLVAASDGIVDKDEWLYCKKLASGLGNSYNEGDSEEAHENLTLIYRGEFRYVLKHLDRWEPKFLKALKQYLVDNDYTKEFVTETIYLFANASEGIVQEEMDKINYLEKELHLK
jgi:hypothetical protein